MDGDGTTGLGWCAVLVALCLHAALAAPPEYTSPVYELEPVPDALFTVSAGLAFGVVSLMRQLDGFDDVCGGPCDPRHLDVIDVYAVGRSSRTWDRVTDVAEIIMILAPYAVDGLDVWLSHAGGLDEWARDALVILQAQLLAGAVGGALKLAVGRPRPKQYSAESFRRGAVREHALPSGHAISLSVGAAALTTTFWLRHPESPLRWVVLGAGALVAGVMAWGRVEAGEHFPTDVLAGLAIGTAAGVAVPWLHRFDDQGVTVAAAPGGLRVSW